MAMDYIDDRAFEAEPVYFTDMDRCEPSSAVSPYPGLGRWRTLTTPDGEPASGGLRGRGHLGHDAAGRPGDRGGARDLPASRCPAGTPYP